MKVIRYENVQKAIKNNSQKDLKKYIDSGFDVNTRSPWGLTLLHEACLNNNHEMVKILLSHGANVESKTFYGEETPLIISIRNDCVENVLILLDNLLSKNTESFLEAGDCLISEANASLVRTVLEKHKLDLSFDKKTALSAVNQERL